MFFIKFEYGNISFRRFVSHIKYIYFIDEKCLLSGWIYFIIFAETLKKRGENYDCFNCQHIVRMAIVITEDGF